MKKLILAASIFMLVGCKDAAPEQVKTTDVIRAYDVNQLEINKDNIKAGTFAYPKAYDKLIAEATELLSAKPLSVMDKPMTPPSGDKHDYMSMGPYWWPNPNTPDSLPYVQRDGEINQVVRNLDNSTFAKFKTQFQKLSLAYYFSGEEKFAAKAAEMLNCWYLDPETYMKPNMDYGQIVPGVADNGRGIGMIEFFGAIYLIDGITMIQDSPSYTAEMHEGLKKWHQDFCEWWINSRNGKEEVIKLNNHGTAYDASLLAIALFAEREDVASEVANNFNAKRMFPQIEADGSMPEELARTKALSYSCFNIRIASAAYRLAKSMGIDLFSTKDTDGASLEGAVNYISQYIGVPQSEFPYKQINSWENTQVSLASLLLGADRMFPGNGLYDKVTESGVKVSEDDMFFLTGIN